MGNQCGCSKAQTDSDLRNNKRYKPEKGKGSKGSKGRHGSKHVKNSGASPANLKTDSSFQNSMAEDLLLQGGATQDDSVGTTALGEKTPRNYTKYKSGQQAPLDQPRFGESPPPESVAAEGLAIGVGFTLKNSEDTKLRSTDKSHMDSRVTIGGYLKADDAMSFDRQTSGFDQERTFTVLSANLPFVKMKKEAELRSKYLSHIDQDNSALSDLSIDSEEAAKEAAFSDDHSEYKLKLKTKIQSKLAALEEGSFDGQGSHFLQLRLKHLLFDEQVTSLSIGLGGKDSEAVVFYEWEALTQRLKFPMSSFPGKLRKLEFEDEILNFSMISKDQPVGQPLQWLHLKVEVAGLSTLFGRVLIKQNEVDRKVIELASQESIAQVCLKAQYCGSMSEMERRRLEMIQTWKQFQTSF